MRLRIHKDTHAKAIICAERAGLSLKRWVTVQVSKHNATAGSTVSTCGGRADSTVIEIDDCSKEVSFIRSAIDSGVNAYDAANDAELHNALAVKANYEGKTLEQVRREFDERVEQRKRELKGNHQ